MTLSDGRTTVLRVGDIVNLKDDHQFWAIVFKRSDGSTHRSFLRTPAHVVISAPPMVNPSTQTDPPPSTTDDPLAQAFLQNCDPDAVPA